MGLEISLSFKDGLKTVLEQRDWFPLWKPVCLVEAGIFITPGSLSDPVLPWLLRGTLASNFTFQFAESG